MRALLKSDKGDYGAARAEADKLIDDGDAKAAAYYVRASIAFDEHDLDAATTDVDKALDLKDTLAAALLLKGRILEARGDKVGAKSRYQQALAQPSSYLEGRSVQRKARDRLNGVDGVATADAALDTKPARNVGCKRFLPATGVTITIDCDK